MAKKYIAKSSIKTKVVAKNGPIKPKFRSGNVGLLTEKIVTTVKAERTKSNG